MTTTIKFTKEQIDFADAIAEGVSASLADWVRHQFELGRSIDGVKAQLNRALATAEAQRA